MSLLADELAQHGTNENEVDRDRLGKAGDCNDQFCSGTSYVGFES
jgi:hypothetical protein